MGCLPFGPQSHVRDLDPDLTVGAIACRRFSPRQTIPRKGVTVVRSKRSTSGFSSKILIKQDTIHETTRNSTKRFVGVFWCDFVDRIFSSLGCGPGPLRVICGFIVFTLLFLRLSLLLFLQ